MGIPRERRNERRNKKLHCSSDASQIEACHWVTKNNKTVIVKFTTCKDLVVLRQGEIFINSSLSPYYEMLWSKSNKLLTSGKTKSFYTLNGCIRIKVNENSSPLSITHVDDFGMHFPDINLSPSRSR